MCRFCIVMRKTSKTKRPKLVKPAPNRHHSQNPPKGPRENDSLGTSLEGRRNPIDGYVREVNISESQRPRKKSLSKVRGMDREAKQE
jgi:hypothetical protein